MFAFAWIFLLAASSSVDFVDEVYQIPAKHWNFIDLAPLKERPARVLARYKSQSASNQVRLVMMGRADLDRLFKGERHQELFATPPAASGSLAHDISRPGDYAIVIDNQSAEPVSVHIRVQLNTPRVITLSPRRQLTVIVLSCAFFFGIVTFSARRLLRVIRR